MAAICGIAIVLLGVLSTGSRPSDAQSTIEIVCLVGGLVLCFLAVVIRRLDVVGNRLASLQAEVGAPLPELEADEAEHTG